MLKKIIATSMLAVFVFGFVGGIFTLSENRVQAADQKSNIFNMEKAIKVVKEKYTNAQVKSVDKELENGKTFFEVEFTDSNGNHEVSIDADTGKILKSFEDEKNNYQNESGEHHNEGNETEDYDNQDNESEEHGEDDDSGSNQDDDYESE
ncbi:MULTISPECIES: PepSY domain-containing protein [Halanaerobium]|uniref:Peptidase YpeB-like protein n=2 Tax=Halanaerobium TaxID=2330 RepID=A0A2T5RQH5_9FIRM|nr:MULTISPECIES: PepSY domain-containing protein [Halanaerobium]PTW02230.1 peptidase YpeB-like protein [Halanaerobium saccharolyticum]PUU89285.1 MAG: hypothetical protein CI949_2781 [Halanaerobium sp.]RCW62229.1 peptidase YpeB-like protein [Halanaerobium sp. ST460_2HS_T2]TDQ01641.1 peptidase YpeB-like protein [Halanaerobium saccharolyticum]SIR37971.1 Peptidase propeptide and YPEB domain-containing protein [Halanaerobium kushneri]